MDMCKKIVTVFIVLIGATILSGCMRGERPFLMIQMCVENQGGMDLLKGEMQSLAVSEGLVFQDASSYTENELKIIGYKGKERADGSPVLNVAAWRKDGMGFGGGNLSLPGYQVALGFSKGGDEAEAKAFALRVISILERHWVIYRIPDGQGAVPMDSC
jgi:hypothetical protein